MQGSYLGVMVSIDLTVRGHRDSAISLGMKENHAQKGRWQADLSLITCKVPLQAEAMADCNRN